MCWFYTICCCIYCHPTNLTSNYYGVFISNGIPAVHMIDHPVCIAIAPMHQTPVGSAVQTPSNLNTIYSAIACIKTSDDQHSSNYLGELHRVETKAS